MLTRRFHKNDDGLFLRLHAPDMPCQSHAVQTCAGAAHLYVQKKKENIAQYEIIEFMPSKSLEEFKALMEKIK